MHPNIGDSLDVPNDAGRSTYLFLLLPQAALDADESHSVLHGNVHAGEVLDEHGMYPGSQCQVVEYTLRIDAFRTSFAGLVISKHGSRTLWVMSSTASSTVIVLRFKTMS